MSVNEKFTLFASAEKISVTAKKMWHFGIKAKKLDSVDLNYVPHTTAGRVAERILGELAKALGKVLDEVPDGTMC